MSKQDHQMTARHSNYYIHQVRQTSKRATPPLQCIQIRSAV